MSLEQQWADNRMVMVAPRRFGFRNGVARLYSAERYHSVGDPHLRGGKLAEIILGGQDGLVNTLGVILGVAAASESRLIVLAGGLAAALAESFSMCACTYTSRVAQMEYEQSEEARERRHIEVIPEREAEEIRQLYAAKGFTGQLLETLVQTITSDRDLWVSVMMKEELNIQSSTRVDALKSAVLVFFAALIASLIPLIPFFFLAPETAIYVSLGLSAAVLFCTGVFKNYTMQIGKAWRGGLELMIIGMVSALLGWGVGVLFANYYPRDDALPMMCNSTLNATVGVN